LRAHSLGLAERTRWFGKARRVSTPFRPKIGFLHAYMRWYAFRDGQPLRIRRVEKSGSSPDRVGEIAHPAPSDRFSSAPRPQLTLPDHPRTGRPQTAHMRLSPYAGDFPAELQIAHGFGPSDGAATPPSSPSGIRHAFSAGIRSLANGPKASGHTLISRAGMVTNPHDREKIRK